ncbi:WG repeat-containing protein [Sporomusa sphaeroides]
MLAGVKLKSKWGYMDTTGKMLIAPQFSDIGVFWNQEMLDRELRYYQSSY